MKRFLLLLLTAYTFGAKAQVYNNEWIDYAKTYYKFKVGATGLYRITQPTLNAIGLGSTPAQDFQLWRNGQEVPIYTSVQTGALGAGDYIEFWGEMNDGKPDSVLYRLPDYQLSKKWSLNTDTASFFLTVNPGAANLRLVPTTNNVAGNVLPPEPFFMYTAGHYFKVKENPGRAELVGDSYTYSSSFEYGEGWTTDDIPDGGTVTYADANLFAYTGPGAPLPVISVNASGNAVHARYFRVKVNGDSVLGATINYYDYAKASAPLALSYLSGGTANVEIKNMCTESSDRMVVAQSELVYARQFNFGGASNFVFDLPANATGNYLEIAGFSFSGPAPVLYDLTNGNRYVADASNPALLKFALLPSSVNRRLVLVSEAPANITGVTTLQQRNFINYGLPANQGDYIIITNPVLTTASDGSNPVDNYRAYRSSPAGGSYNAKIYMIDELNDQFGLGIKKHPLSIRNFLRWIRANYSSPVKDVLLIGKGVVYLHSRLYESDPNLAKLDLVPPFGFPASDNMLSAEGGSSVPLTPIGRISAISGDEVADYLKKVKEYEQAQTISSPVVADKSWMKEIIHVVGAGDQNTSDILLTALNGHKTIIEDTLYGGHVTTFAKNSADYVQQAENDRLTGLINNGIGILTYFGHSSSSTLEFNLDNPMNYNNTGKYPVFIVMGCNAGNFFNFNLARLSTKETLSEKYVLAPEHGSIAFLASTHLGIVHYLDIYNTQNYTAASITKYGATLGEIMDEAIRKVFGITTENDFYARFQCEQFTLHGDPALRYYHFGKPDYAIESPMVKVSPNFITVGDHNYNVKASFMNLGKATSDSIYVQIKQTRPDLSQGFVQRVKVKGTRFIDSINFVVPIDPSFDKGLNKITITLDPDNYVDELYENNNSVTKDVFIYEDEARPIFPYNYSIVNQQNIRLYASSANPFAALRTYMMEMDTTAAFNSPLKVSGTVSSAGGVFDFTPGITFTDSTVYYWRVAPQVNSGSPVWNVSSFIYLNGPGTGFNQSHYFQHANSATQRMRLAPDRSWIYDSLGHNIFIKNGVFLAATFQEGDLIVSIDGDPYIRSACVGYSLIFNIIDPNTLLPKLNVVPGGGPGQYGSAAACFESRQWNFEWTYMDAAHRKMMMDFMDSIPNGYYVAVRSINNQFQPPGGWVQDWKNDTLLYGSGNSLYHKLKAVGFTNLDSFYLPRAIAFLYKKNDPNFAPISAVSQGMYDMISINRDVKSPDTTGFVTSPLFGPSKGWQQLKWRGNMELPVRDTATIDVIGVRNDGSETVLVSGITLAQQDYDISTIDATQYPFMKLKMRASDATYFTPYQLRYWRVYYTPVPEGAVAPNLYFTGKDTVDVGEPFNFGIAFKNVSNVDFDSVKVKLTITDQNNVGHPYVWRLKKLTTVAPDDTIRFTAPIDTRTIPGHNTIQVEFNPDYDQPEQYLNNNFVYRNLYVRPDSLHPVLDVTFDGVHILNQDIVSSRPDILVKLKDEAKWMILDDTSLLSVSVKFPDGSVHHYAFTNDSLQFIPAGQAPNNNNTATINFRPYFPVDGTYELTVSGKDRSSNTAGAAEYRVSFQVINKPMISNMLNYPNPFTTSTAFVFTITGSQVPQNIRIQILTITGKIVRDITKEELGPLRIGRNITEFKWDGTDQYGQKLANGIYLYRVITNLNGKSLDKYKSKDDNTDQYFKQGYGKMYLMR